MRIFATAMIAVLGVAGLMGCSVVASRNAPLNVPLVYRPSEMLSGPQTTLRGPISVSVVDERVNKQAVGQNSEKSTVVPVISNDSPATFVESAIVQQLQMRGSAISTDGKGAAKKVVFHLTSFWTEEDTTYRCQISGRGEVLDSRGRQIWEGVVSGTSERFGLSLRPANYQECFSDATLRMVNWLLADPGLTAAMK